jgi:hypothetical protein
VLSESSIVYYFVCRSSPRRVLIRMKSIVNAPDDPETETDETLVFSCQ